MPIWKTTFGGGTEFWLEHLPSLLEAYDRNLAARYRRVVELIERRTQRVFGDGWHFFALRSFLRRLSGTNGILRWHIDADAAATNWGHCINVWLPLDAVGTDRPSVDVILGSHFKMRELPLLSGDSHDRDDTFVASIGPTTSSGLNPGDALVFDHFTLHRTQPWHSENFSRTACELRFFFEAPIRTNLKKLRGALPAPLKRATAENRRRSTAWFCGDSARWHGAMIVDRCAAKLTAARGSMYRMSASLRSNHMPPGPKLTSGSLAKGRSIELVLTAAPVVGALLTDTLEPSGCFSTRHCFCSSFRASRHSCMRHRLAAALGRLLLASMLFYASWDYRYLVIIFAIAAVAYVYGHACRHLGNGAARWALAGALVLILLPLAFFKYATSFSAIWLQPSTRSERQRRTDLQPDPAARHLVLHVPAAELLPRRSRRPI